MLIDTQYLNNTKKLVVSYVDKTGDIKLKYFDWQNPQKYVTCDDNDKDKHPKYKSWDGKSVKLEPVTNPDRYTIYEFLDALPEKEKEEIFEYNLPKIFFIDIETDSKEGFPNMEYFDKEIISISIRHFETHTYTFLIDRNNKSASKPYITIGEVDSMFEFLICCKILCSPSPGVYEEENITF